jgi:hypothetical protein
MQLQIQPMEGQVPTKRREITIRFVTSAQGAKISSIIDAFSAETDDVSITCRTLDRPTGRRPTAQPATKNGHSVNTASNGIEHPENDEEEPEPHRSQLVYRAEGLAVHRRCIDVEASLAKLKLTREDLMARKWPRGSPQHRLKRAAADNGVH